MGNTADVFLERLRRVSFAAQLTFPIAPGAASKPAWRGLRAWDNPVCPVSGLFEHTSFEHMRAGSRAVSAPFPQEGFERLAFGLERPWVSWASL